MPQAKKKNLTNIIVNDDNQIIDNKKPEEVVDTPTRRLRSNFKITDENNEPASAKQKAIVIEDLPFVEYSGKIDYYTEMGDMAFVCENLM